MNKQYQLIKESILLEKLSFSNLFSTLKLKNFTDKKLNKKLSELPSGFIEGIKVLFGMNEKHEANKIEKLFREDLKKFIREGIDVWNNNKSNIIHSIETGYDIPQNKINKALPYIKILIVNHVVIGCIQYTADKYMNYSKNPNQTFSMINIIYRKYYKEYEKVNNKILDILGISIIEG